jgi:hypothetical protein
MKYSTIKDRAFTALNLKQYNNLNKPDRLGGCELAPPEKDYYILRMLIKNTLGEYKLPDNLQWVYPLVQKAQAHQDVIGVAHSFCYLTIRTKNSRTADEWHVDGFSTKITHIPEQNYVWVNKNPTLIATCKYNFPKEFNPRKHNIHWFFQDRINYDAIYMYQLDCSTIYCMDPYVIHKRPYITSNQSRGRIFVRISHTPIEIADINNTINPLIQTNYTRDGIKDFRNSLIRF